MMLSGTSFHGNCPSAVPRIHLGKDVDLDPCNLPSVPLTERAAYSDHKGYPFAVRERHEKLRAIKGRVPAR